MKNIFLTIILFFPAYAFGQVKPDIKVDAPQKVDRDEGYVQLFVLVENQDDLPAKAKLNHVWVILEDGVERKRTPTFEGGTTVLIPTRRTKVITYKVQTSYEYEIRKTLKVKDKDGKDLPDAKVYVGESTTPSKDVLVGIKTVKSEELSGEIHIDGGVPPTPPNPGPSPNPTPPNPEPDPVPPQPEPGPTFPDGKFGLSQIVYTMAMSRVSPTGRTKAPALADSYEQMAKRIATSQTKLAAGVPLLPTDLKLDESSIQKELRSSNANAVGALASEWQQWDEGYKDVIYGLYEKNVFSTTPEDFKTAFQEIALGLRQVK
jgi:hypothetical protein